MTVLGWCTASASADPAVLAQWNLDEGTGQVAADATGHANTGTLGAAPDPDAADPGWIPGHAGGGALNFNGSTYVSIANTGLLEPRRLAIDAWVLRSGSPGQWRYVLSNGSLSAIAVRTASTPRGAGAWRSMSPARRSTRSRPRSRPRRSGTAPGTTSSAPTTGTACGCGSTARRSARERPRPRPSRTPTTARHLHRHLSRLVRPRLQRRDRRCRGLGRPPAGGDHGPGHRAGRRHPDPHRARRRHRRRGARCHQEPAKGCLRVSLSRNTIPPRRRTKLVATVRRGQPRRRRARHGPRQGRHHHGPAHRPQGQDEDLRARTQGRAPRRSWSAARRPAARATTIRAR